MSERVDVAIVGAGTAGLAALREVQKRTDNFVLIHAPPYGTTCARAGCMPSKALIAAANAFHARARFGAFGIRGGDHLSADIPAVLARVRRLRDRFVYGVLETTEDLSERRITGSARLDGPNRVIVGGRSIEAQRIVLAPGSSPIVPKAWQAFRNRILTTDTLFEAEDLHPRIGAIGVEMAQALSRLGLEVHGFDGAQGMAGIGDERVADTLTDALGAEFAVHLGVEVDLAEVERGVEIRWG